MAAFGRPALCCIHEESKPESSVFAPFCAFVSLGHVVDVQSSCLYKISCKILGSRLLKHLIQSLKCWFRSFWSFLSCPFLIDNATLNTLTHISSSSLLAVSDHFGLLSVSSIDSTSYNAHACYTVASALMTHPFTSEKCTVCIQSLMSGESVRCVLKNIETDLDRCVQDPSKTFPHLSDHPNPYHSRGSANEDLTSESQRDGQRVGAPSEKSFSSSHFSVDDRLAKTHLSEVPPAKNEQMHTTASIIDLMDTPPARNERMDHSISIVDQLGDLSLNHDPLLHGSCNHRASQQSTQILNPPASLGGLPTEILCQISTFLRRKELLCLRLMSKRFYSVASSNLFEFLTIKADYHSMIRFQNVAESPVWNKQVRYLKWVYVGGENNCIHVMTAPRSLTDGLRVVSPELQLLENMSQLTVLLWKYVRMESKFPQVDYVEISPDPRSSLVADVPPGNFKAVLPATTVIAYILKMRPSMIYTAHREIVMRLAYAPGGLTRKILMTNCSPVWTLRPIEIDCSLYSLKKLHVQRMLLRERDVSALLVMTRNLGKLKLSHCLIMNEEWRNETVSPVAGILRLMRIMLKGRGRERKRVSLLDIYQDNHAGSFSATDDEIRRFIQGLNDDLPRKAESCYQPLGGGGVRINLPPPTFKDVDWGLFPVEES